MSVAERTLVSAENPSAGADKTTDASQAGLRSENCSLVEPRCVEYAGALSAAGGALPKARGDDQPRSRPSAPLRVNVPSLPQGKHSLPLSGERRLQRRGRSCGLLRGIAYTRRLATNSDMAKGSEDLTGLRAGTAHTSIKTTNSSWRRLRKRAHAAPNLDACLTHTVSAT